MHYKKSQGEKKKLNSAKTEDCNYTFNVAIHYPDIKPKYMLCLKMKATGIRMHNSIKNNHNAALDIRNANITDPRKYINFPLLQNWEAEKNILQIRKTLQQALRGSGHRENISNHLKL